MNPANSSAPSTPAGTTHAARTDEAATTNSSPVAFESHPAEALTLPPSATSSVPEPALGLLGGLAVLLFLRRLRPTGR